ncbi:hypothetical protein AVEN_82748-1 [Araneus ventricosus]|uniref:Uncharacterized protein n=1 Tax=Araneus ventricosus TaxID=182803 RepID=A0A4Y2EBG0_ARAVE|nr:hypothetical protein AVEN_82748-1 [Araneus ventricosus]
MCRTVKSISRNHSGKNRCPASEGSSSQPAAPLHCFGSDVSKFFTAFRTSSLLWKSNEEVRQAVKNFLLSLGTDIYQDGFLKLISRYDKCCGKNSQKFVFFMPLHVSDCNKASL